MDSVNLNPVIVPSSNFLRKIIIYSVIFFIVTAFWPTRSEFYTGYALPYGMAYYNDFVDFQDLVLDEEGFISKEMPQIDEYDRSLLKDNFIHTVSEGENLSAIAQKYGLKKVSTLIWENNLSPQGYIKIGQKLIIPPIDGVTHKIAKNENLESIAKKYGINAEIIAKQNSLLLNDKLELGQKIFIPGGKKIDPPQPKYFAQSKLPKDYGKVNYVPTGDKPFIFPTSGQITQNFHSGHYAHDIANTAQPHVWAAGAGKVIKKSVGTYGGGYGNYVILDHGNGLTTLYAHLQSVYVEEGQYVDQGQVIGRMGRSGRVYGATGIHLHFEVRVNGVKKSPWLYY